MTPQPLVSILTPSLNQVDFVEDCLRSVAGQNYPNIEQIVVDGGSTDGTLEIIERHAGSRVRLKVLKGSSNAEALNEALRLSHGQIIGWLNTDDALFGVDGVATVVDAFEAEPKCDIVYGDGATADACGLILRHVSTDARRLSEVQPWSPLVQPAVFFRRSLVGAVFLRENLHLHVDYDFWLRVHRSACFRKVNRVLAIDRVHDQRKTDVFSHRRATELRELSERNGVPLNRRPAIAHAASNWTRRLRGIPTVLTIERRYELAFDGQLDARWRRVVRQVALPNRLTTLV